MSTTKAGDTAFAYSRLTTAAGVALSFANAAAFEAGGWAFAYFADGTITSAKVYTCAVMTGTAKEIALGALGWHKFTWTAQDAVEDVFLYHSGTSEAWPATLRGLFETYDLDSVAAVISAPIVSVVSAGGPQGDITLRGCKGDYVPVSFTVTDQSGAAINLSAYTLPTFGVKSKDQTTTTYSLAGAAITMSSAGLVTIAIPESAGFWAALTTGVDEISLRFSFEANEGGDATKTRTLARGPFIVMRKET